jgi:hypothetical protein
MTAPDTYSKGDRVTVLGTAGTGADTIGAIAGPDATGTISGPFYRDPSQWLVHLDKPAPNGCWTAAATLAALRPLPPEQDTTR